MRDLAKAALTLIFAVTAVLAGPAAPALAQEAAIPKKPIPYKQYTRRLEPPRKAVTAAGAPGSAAAAAPAAPLAPGATPLPPPPPMAPGARLAPGVPIPPAELEAFVDGVVAEAMGRDHIAGVTVSVVQLGQVALKKGYGYASLSPARRVDPDRTLFRVGSISKTFTWIMLMREAQAGRMRLTAPINLYLPEKLQVRDQGYSTPIRVINLMDHSAGFEDRALGHLFEKSFDRVRPIDLYLRQERPKRVRAPGAVSSYSNYGVALAGAAVSYVRSEPFETLAEREIFRPLGLARTTFREPHPPKSGLPAPMSPVLARDVSQAFAWGPGGYQARPFEYAAQIAPAASASSTAGDMSRYMLMLLNGGHLDGVVVYGPNTARAFRTPLKRTAPGVNGWPHGFMESALPGGFKGYGHTGETLSFLSQMVVIPDLGLGVFVSTNTDTGRRLKDTLPGEVVARFYAPPPVPPVAPRRISDDAEIYEGRYLLSRRAAGGLEAFVDLLIGGRSVRVAGPDKLIVEGIGHTETWIADGPAGAHRFRSLDEPQALAFQTNGGRAASFQVSQNLGLYQRAPALLEPGILALLAALTGAAAVATLIGLIFRDRREMREAMIQQRASLLQTIQAGLWLTAFLCFALFVGRARDEAAVIYGWPDGWLVTASASALIASLLSIGTLVVIPAVWRGGRRVDSWTGLRKLAFSFTAILYVIFAVDLWFWGALAPWSG
jgi:CubicO group peptidase (beta-lactamase class C family)